MFWFLLVEDDSVQTMMSKLESGKGMGEDPGSGRLLRDLEEISKALYLHRTPPKALTSSSSRRSKSAGKTRFPEPKSRHLHQDLTRDEKKSSLWIWKPLKALSQFRNHCLSCFFLLHVHSIEGLPLNFNNLSLSVHWKRKEEEVKTHPARVSKGMAKFEETLLQRCSVHTNVSKSGPHFSTVKYKPKHFLVSSMVIGAQGLDIGKHWIDLTRLLPLTLEELEEEKKCSGKWTTSFKLTGKAEGATINVTFGFYLSRDNVLEPTDFLNISNISKADGKNRNTGMLRRTGSLSRNSKSMTHMPSHSSDVKVHNGVIPYKGSEITRSIAFLFQKLDEGKLRNLNERNTYSADPFELKPEPFGENFGYESDDSEFVVVEHGVEIPLKGNLKTEEGDAKSLGASAIVETINVAEVFGDNETAFGKENTCEADSDVYANLKDAKVECNKEAVVDEIESLSLTQSMSEPLDLNFSQEISKFLDEEHHRISKSNCDEIEMEESLSFDDIAESVANDFMNMLEVEHFPLFLGYVDEPESPRECLLRQFEEEALASGNPILNLDSVLEPGGRSGDFDLSIRVDGSKTEHNWMNSSPTRVQRAKVLENLETEALMQEWGLNETAFHNSPRTNSGAFGSPVYLFTEEPPQLPSLGEGFGPIIRMKDDGFLQSMNPSLFRHANNSERLIMQVSRSIVLPAAMGSNGREILQRWALVGAEKMCHQTNRLMPLEEITGKTLQLVAWEGESEMEVLGRDGLLLQDQWVGDNLYERGHEVDETKPEVLDELNSGFASLEDLIPLAMDKIQSLLIEGLRIQAGLSGEDAPSSITLHSIGKTVAFSTDNITCLNDIVQLLNLSLTLNDWMRLDWGVIRDEYETSGQVSKILEAHHTHSTDLARCEKWGKPLSKSFGYLGNKLMLAHRVLLRDPFRDNEAVGTSMLALIQVERNFMERQIDIETGDNQTREGLFPWFKVVEVHVAGLNTELGKKQQPGSRWLQSSGLGKTKKCSFLTSNAIVSSSSHLIRKTKHEDILWSLSSYVHDPEPKWKELSNLNLHARNPDIVFP